MNVEDQTDLIAWLSRPEAYGRRVKSVDRVETHISFVFLAGDRAYKLKKAVRFPYLDFSTAERRHAACTAELDINRRTAPELYMAVVPIVRSTNKRYRLGAGGEPVDWLVRMVRFDERLVFDRLAENGMLDRFAMESLADEVARFHRDAEPCPDAAGWAALSRTIDDNRRALEDSADALIEPAEIDALTTASRAALDDCREILERRRRDGFVRRCHGDLHLRNVVAYKGRPVLFDAVEFSDALAEIDVLYDLAFMVMDLECRDLSHPASILLNRYLDVTGDAGGLTALPLFLSLRAAIRAHVEAATAKLQSDPAQVAEYTDRARRYFDRARAYLTPETPSLIAIGGLSGSGKSRLARALAPCLGPAPGARVVRTDTTRKRLAGVSFNARLGSSAYTFESNQVTYDAVFQEAATALRAGRSVIADAVFAAPDERAGIEEVARQAGVAFRGLWLDAPAEVLEERVTHRRHNASDATAFVVRMQLQYDLGTVEWPRLDSSGDRDETLAMARARLGR